MEKKPRKNVQKEKKNNPHPFKVSFNICQVNKLITIGWEFIDNFLPLLFIIRQICSDEEISSSNENIEDNPEHGDTKSLLYTEKEEEKLPSFKHEEHPPESEDSEEEHDFINDEEDTEHSTSSSEGAEDGSDKSEDSESYVNPYMERNNEMERQDILQILSKSTEKDKDNKRR